MKKYITRTIPVTEVSALCVNVVTREFKDFDVKVYGYMPEDKEFKQSVDSFVSLETNGDFSVLDIVDVSEVYYEKFRIPVDLFAIYGESRGVVNEAENENS